jgi:hypothetical protein
LLCIERTGDLVIVELKRDKTPREITAQTLDYASWVTELSRERISALVSLCRPPVGQPIGALRALLRRIVRRARRNRARSVRELLGDPYQCLKIVTVVLKQAHLDCCVPRPLVLMEKRQGLKTILHGAQFW